jgi:hypothetical protein
MQTGIEPSAPLRVAGKNIGSTVIADCILVGLNGQTEREPHLIFPFSFILMLTNLASFRDVIKSQGDADSAINIFIELKNIAPWEQIASIKVFTIIGGKVGLLNIPIILYSKKTVSNAWKNSITPVKYATGQPPRPII